MSEIEKAREALYAKLDGDVTAPWSVVDAIENLVVAAMTEYGNRIREIAREEIEANEERLVREMHGEIERGRECDETGALTEEGGDPHSVRRSADKSPPAVEAPAAGDRGSSGALLAASYRDGYEAGKADTTALARRLAEALHASFRWGWGGNPSVDQQIDAALTEARKAGLIE